MNWGPVISVQANIGAADVKPRNGGWSHNYMPPEAAHAVEQARKALATLAK